MISAQKLKELHDKVDAVAQKAIMWEANLSTGKIRFPVLTDTDGDALIFNGLLSSTGFKPSITACIESQAWDGNGRFYRSPIHRINCEESFSRDQAHGVLAFYAANGGSEIDQSACKWLGYIDDSRPCSVKKPWGGGCLVRSPIWYYAPGVDSAINPGMWGIMKRVWDFHGWGLHSEMIRWTGYDGDINNAEAANNPLGYQVHLPVVVSYVKILIDQSIDMARGCGAIAFKRQPDNLFYEFVARNDVTQDMVDRLLALFPSPDHKWGNAWIWEKGNISAEIANTCGWDFVFLGRLFLKFYGVV